MWIFQLLHSATQTLHCTTWMWQFLAITKVHTQLVWCGGCWQGKFSACVAASADRLHGKPCLISTSIEILKRWQKLLFFLYKHPQISVPPLNKLSSKVENFYWNAHHKSSQRGEKRGFVFMFWRVFFREESFICKRKLGNHESLQEKTWNSSWAFFVSRAVFYLPALRVSYLERKFSILFC